MQLENKISIKKAFEKDLELTQRFAKNRATLEDIGTLSDLSNIPPQFITTNLHLVRNLAQSI